jgi:hypothetical protein
MPASIIATHSNRVSSLGIVSLAAYSTITSSRIPARNSWSIAESEEDLTCRLQLVRVHGFEIAIAVAMGLSVANAVTSSTATFSVPAGVILGPTTVIATNAASTGTTAFKVGDLLMPAS